MYFFVAEDQYYYTYEGISFLKNKYSIKEINILNPFLIKDIATVYNKYIATLRENPANYKDIAILSPINIDLIKNSFFFEKVYLPNKEGLFTLLEHKEKIPLENILDTKLGVKVKKPYVTLSDYGGANFLKQEAKLIQTKELFGLTIKGFLIAGIPGSGKSFFAECLAGEMNKLLIELNLAKFLDYERPIDRINMFFDFFLNNGGDYIIRIDEIEKMLEDEKSETILGVFLTRMNDFGKEDTKSNAFIVATANNLSKLFEKHPELPRAGRFDYLLYLGSPNEASAKEIFSIYIKKNIQKIENIIKRIVKNPAKYKEISFGEKSLIKKITDLLKKFEPQEIIQKLEPDLNFPIQIFMHQAQMKYRIPKNNFIYTPAEIEYIVNTYYSILIEGNYNQKDDLILSIINKIKPLQIMLKDEVINLEAKANDFVKI